MENEELDNENNKEIAEEKKDKDDKKSGKVKKIDKASEYAIKKIKSYLDDLALKDELFAKKYNLSEKDISKCWKFICDKAQKDNRQCIHSSEMYRWAFEFYNDDLKSNGKISSSGNFKVMGENKEEDDELTEYAKLTDDEKLQLKKEAEEEFKNMKIEELEKKEKNNIEKQKAKQKDIVKKKEEEDGYIPLF